MDTTRKEDNEVNQIGIIPSFESDPIPVGKIPDRGTQVIKQSNVANGVAIIHTVSAGKTLYLVSWSLCPVLCANGACSIFLRDVGDVLRAYLEVGVCVAARPIPSMSNTVIPPMEIPSGWDVCVESSVAGLTVYSMIFGYEM